MKTTKEHLQSLQRFRPMFEALAGFMDDGDTLATLQQSHDEAERRLKDKRAEEAKVDDRLAFAKSAEDETKKLRIGVNAECEKLKERARADGDKITADASKEAERIIAAAEEQAQKILKPYEDKREKVAAEIVNLETRRDALMEEISAKVDEHSDLTGKIQSLRDTAAHIVKTTT